MSQGQKQRILLARVFYRQPDIIILDEATSGLDTESETIVMKNLLNYCKERTLIVVAHRLSTVIKADRILVLDRGKIIESGTHSELIACKGKYFTLVKNQLELGA